ncbi:MAG: serine/threonine-protein kinase [Syntrophobacteraceae bacterium]|jgi:serine/threonine protein kinase
MSKPPAFELAAKILADQLNFSFERFVARGAFKETYLAKDGRKLVAIKIFDPSKCSLARSQREIEAAKRCSSNRLCCLLEYGESKVPGAGAFYYSVEEYLEGGTLTERIDSGTLTNKIIKYYSVCIAEAIAHLKDLQLVHRDIKPDNIMFRREANEPVLVDLGLVRDLSQPSLTKSWLPRGPGTPYYSAPEQLNNEKHLIDWRTDQFSLGLVIGFCLTGVHPFQSDGATVPEAIEAVAQKKGCSEWFAEKLQELSWAPVLKMLEPWPNRRFNVPELLIKSLAEMGE